MNIAKRLFQPRFGCYSYKVIFERIATQAPAISSDKESIELVLNNRKERFPLVWLRDNCTCEKCYHKQTISRIINWVDFNTNVAADSVEAVNKDSILVKWADNHQSTYSYEWLESRSFSKEAQKFYMDTIYQPSNVLWDKDEFKDIFHFYEYEEIVTKKEKFYQWLRDLATYGVVLIQNAPTTDKNIVKDLANKVAFIRKSHYGEDYEITAKPDARNAAYVPRVLQLHTDLPYYDFVPGVVLLHCIVQTKSKGGENLLTDSFYVAEKLRSENKVAFDVLTTTPVNWFDIGVEGDQKFHKIMRAPVISVDIFGKIQFVRQSIHLRDSYFTVDADKVKPWYDAMKIFVNAMNEHAAKFKTKPGDILAFDNARLVHGRLGYEDTTDNHRLLVGCYLDWDEVYSKLRVLAGELNLFTHK